MSQGNDMIAEMRELMALLREDQLTADRAQRLAELVRDDPVARRIYIEHITSYASLRWYLSGSEGNPEIELLAISSGSVLALLEQNAAVARREAEERARRECVADDKRWQRGQETLTRRTIVPRNITYATIASVVAALILLIFWMLPGPVFVAKIVAEIGPVWGDEGAAMPLEANLQEGQLLDLEAGLLEIEFGDGAWVILEGPAQFTVQSGAAGALQIGRLVARVPSEAHGFRIDTPESQIVDVGTEFAVEIQQPGRTDVLVFEGGVQARSLSDSGVLGLLRTLTQGASLQFLANGVVREGVRVEDAHALQKLARRLRESSREPNLERGLLAYYSFEDSSPIDDIGQIGDGRNVGSPGYVFDADRGGTVLEVSRTGGANYVEVAANANIPEGAEPRTVAFWVRMDDNENNGGLFHSGLTQVRGDFSIEQTAASDVITFNAWETDDFDFRIPSGFKRWHHIAVTYDGNVVRAYINGLAGKSSIVGSLNTGTSGMRFGGPRFPPKHINGNNTGMNGRLDDISIYARALSDKEVGILHSRGLDVSSRRPSSLSVANE